MPYRTKIDPEDNVERPARRPRIDLPSCFEGAVRLASVAFMTAFLFWAIALAVTSDDDWRTLIVIGLTVLCVIVVIAMAHWRGFNGGVR